MFKVNDHIMYGMVGVCKVVDIKKEKITNSIEKDYYVLAHIYSKNVTIKIPVDNKKIPMRKLVSKEEVTSMINNINNDENIWIDDEKIRSMEFKSILKNGKCEELMKLITSIYSNKEEKKTLGKKINRNDEGIVVAAEKLLNEELATILNICPEEVTLYIQSRILQ
ncbi:CarD family transcriptional regulator [Romboutsia sp.]|uniref:CarD family transcriptional regulator n=1 Tax=Romboutsia sp. TaxID=1965302 RepID=UPI003F418D5C